MPATWILNGLFCLMVIAVAFVVVTLTVRGR